VRKTTSTTSYLYQEMFMTGSSLCRISLRVCDAHARAAPPKLRHLLRFSLQHAPRTYNIHSSGGGKDARGTTAGMGIGRRMAGSAWAKRDHVITSRCAMFHAADAAPSNSNNVRASGRLNM